MISRSERTVARWAVALRRAELGDPDELIGLCTNAAPEPYPQEIRNVLLYAPWSVHMRRRKAAARKSASETIASLDRIKPRLRAYATIRRVP